MQNLVSKKEEEERRLKALAEYRILGTKPESCYDDITKIAATTCNVPISLMTLVAWNSLCNRQKARKSNYTTI